MCHFLPVHHFGMACLAARRSIFNISIYLSIYLSICWCSRIHRLDLCRGVRSLHRVHLLVVGGNPWCLRTRFWWLNSQLLKRSPDLQQHSTLTLIEKNELSKWPIQLICLLYQVLERILLSRTYSSNCSGGNQVTYTIKS